MTATWVYMGWYNYFWVGNILVALIALGVMPLIPAGVNVNRRVPLTGSRFSAT